MRGYWYLVLAACCYASMGVLVKALSNDFAPFTQTALRLAVSGMLTLLLVILTKKSFLLKDKKDYYLMLFMGTFGFAGQIIFFTFSLYYTTVGNTLFILSAYPIITAILAHYFLREKITTRLLFSLALLVCALYLFFTPEGLSTSILGSSFALITGITVGVYIICSRKMTSKGIAAETITLWSVWLAFFVSLLGALFFEPINYHPSSQAIMLLVLFGFFNFAAVNLINKGFVTVQASTGTMILMLEPIVGSLLGLVLFNEIPTGTFFVGAVLMILAIYIAVFRQSKKSATSSTSAKTT